MQATAIVADAAIPKPSTPATSAGLVYNGSAWVAALLVNGNIDPAANIVYSKLSLAGSIVNNDVASGAAIAYSKLSLTGSIQNSDISSSAAIAQSKLANGPAFEISYSQIASTVNIVSTTEASGTTIISPGAITFDGSPVMVEFFAHVLDDTAAAGDVVVVSLFEGATQITRLCVVASPTNTAQMAIPVTGLYRFTPTATSHTYTITAFATSATGTPAISVGSGGVAGRPPGFVRFSKV